MSSERVFTDFSDMISQAINRLVNEGTPVRLMTRLDDGNRLMVRLRTDDANQRRLASISVECPKGDSKSPIDFDVTETELVLVIGKVLREKNFEVTSPLGSPASC